MDSSQDAYAFLVWSVIIILLYSGTGRCNYLKSLQSTKKFYRYYFKNLAESKKNYTFDHSVKPYSSSDKLNQMVKINDRH